MLSEERGFEVENLEVAQSSRRRYIECLHIDSRIEENVAIGAGFKKQDECPSFPEKRGIALPTK
jgi:hypothetical protein